MYVARIRGYLGTVEDRWQLFDRASIAEAETCFVGQLGKHSAAWQRETSNIL